jgi:hypothetical protein
MTEKLVPQLRIAALALAGALVSGAMASPPSAEWQFTVRLDGQPIGTHRFVLARADEGGTLLRSEARFDVKLLGLSLYRYRHEATERWSDGCLASIDARTEDNGRRIELSGQVRGERFDLQLRGNAGASVPTPVAGCLMSFAYWNPSLAAQTRLLDPGSGRVEAVAIGVPPRLAADLEPAGDALRGLRIGGLAQPIDVWYAGERWVGLDTVVDGGRRLSYRLR